MARRATSSPGVDRSSDPTPGSTHLGHIGGGCTCTGGVRGGAALAEAGASAAAELLLLDVGAVACLQAQPLLPSPASRGWLVRQPRCSAEACRILRGPGRRRPDLVHRRPSAARGGGGRARRPRRDVAAVRNTGPSACGCADLAVTVRRAWSRQCGASGGGHPIGQGGAASCVRRQTSW